MSKKKKIYLIAGLALLFVYLLLLFYVIHVGYLLKSDPWMTLGEAFSGALSHLFLHPFQISPVSMSVVGMFLVATVIVLMVIIFAYQTTKLKRHDDERTVAGDAAWMTQKELDEYNIRYTEPFGKPYAKGYGNFIMSNDIYLSSNTDVTGRNLNVFVIGGTGVGKSFRLIGPNILQRNASFIVTDPSGGLYRRYGPYLEYFGYRVKCFNLDHTELSNHYNLFRYIHSDKDIEVLVTMIISNTTDEKKNGGDPFWDKSEHALLVALISYLYHYARPDQQNLSNVLNLVRSADVEENGGLSAESVLDRLFSEVDKDSFTMRQYQTFRLAPEKTMKSIIISCGVRLEAFDLDEIRDLTSKDDINLEAIADEKTALFIIIPTGETTFNYIAGLMYSQLFSSLYRYCENYAKFSQVIVTSDNQVVRTYRSKNLDEMKEQREKAEQFFESIKGGRIVKNESLSFSDGDKKMELWEIRTANDELVGYRGSEKLAREAFEQIINGKVVRNTELWKNSGGEQCPVHVRFLLDEFANTGKIPDFTQRISTVRKYGISLTIILQSLKQIQNLYEKDWDTITANCGTAIYLGGGLDVETTEWFSKLLGKKTVRAMNMSFSDRGGSSSIQHSGIELYSMSQLRTMKNLKCVIIPQSENAYLGKMYDTPGHPDWDLLQSLPSYHYDAARSAYFNIAFHDKDPFTAPPDQDEKHGPVPEEAEDDRRLREARNEASEKAAKAAKDNKDSIGEELVSESMRIEPNDETLKEVLGAETEEEAEADMINMLEFNFDDGAFDFSSAPMDSVSSDAGK